MSSGVTATIDSVSAPNVKLRSSYRSDSGGRNRAAKFSPSESESAMLCWGVGWGWLV